MTKRVLIADDSETTRRILCTFIEKQPALEVCAQTTNGLDAVNAAIALRPDLIILDVRMPRLNGVEVAGILKKNLPNVKVVLFTMYADIFTKHLPAAIGASTILSKTEGLSVLAKKIYDLLQISSNDSGGNALSVPDSSVELNADDPVKSLKAALRDTEDRFRSTFEQTAVGIAHAGKNGQLLRVNQRFCNILGYTESELLQLNIEDITYPEDVRADLAYTRRLSAGEIDHFTLDKRYIRKDGQIAWVRLTVDAVRDTWGKLQYCIRILEDRNDLRKALDNFTRSQRHHQIAASHLALLTGRMAAPLTHCSRDFKYLWVNQHYADWLKKPMDKIVGRPILDVVGKQAFRVLRPQFERVLRGEDVTYEGTAEYDGIGSRHISAIYKPTLDVDGVPDGWVSFIEDITDRNPAR